MSMEGRDLLRSVELELVKIVHRFGTAPHLEERSLNSAQTEDIEDQADDIHGCYGSKFLGRLQLKSWELDLRSETRCTV